MKLGKAVVRSRVVILIIALALMVPSVIGMICTRVNYDMLNYLPEGICSRILIRARSRF